MLRQGGSKRAGFTLPEVLVTVAIVSVLAAIVVPTVTNQISKGDDTNIQTNSASIRTGITAFVSDARRFPGRLQHIVTQPVAADLDIAGGAYGAAVVSRWRGPYMSGSLRAHVSTSPIDSINWSLAYAIDSLSDTSYTAANGFVGLTLGGIASNAVAMHIDSLIDGGTGQTLGNLRWNLTAGAPTNGRLTLLLLGSR
jgi:prepilin-type N-terminal cleavage/methylation domain-containing protein